MKIPSTYKGMFKLFIAIADQGKDWLEDNNSKIDESDKMIYGHIVADIQNTLGENRELLEKLNLEYYP